MVMAAMVLPAVLVAAMAALAIVTAVRADGEVVVAIGD